MKCYVHPNEEAVAICKSCGKGLCKDCNIDIQMKSYCKNCVSENLPQRNDVDSQYSSLFGPAAELERAFKSGADGLLALGITSLFIVIFWSISDFYNMQADGAAFVTVCWVIATAICILVASVGYNALRTAYGNNIGLIAKILGYLSSVFLFLFLPLSLIIEPSAISSLNVGNATNGTVIFGYLTFTIFGLAQITWGIAQITSRQYTGKLNLALASGAIMIVSGCVISFAILLFDQALIPGLMIFAVSAFISSAVFATAKKPRIS